MTNQDINRELNLIRQTLQNLQKMSKTKGIQGRDLSAIIRLTAERFEGCSSNVKSRLRVYEMVEKERIGMNGK